MFSVPKARQLLNCYDFASVAGTCVGKREKAPSRPCGWEWKWLSNLPLNDSTKCAVHLFTLLLNSIDFRSLPGRGWKSNHFSGWGSEVDGQFSGALMSISHKRKSQLGVWANHLNVLNKRGSRESKARSSILGNTTTIPHTFCQETSTVSILVCDSQFRYWMGRGKASLALPSASWFF